MPCDADRVPAQYLAGLLRRCGPQHTACEAALRAAGMRPSVLELPGLRMPPGRLDAALLALAGLTRRADLGFEMGRSIDLLAGAPLGNLLRCAPTLGAALLAVARYMPLLSASFRFDVRATARGIALRCRARRTLPPRVAAMALECILVVAHETCRGLLRASSVELVAAVPWDDRFHRERHGALRGLVIEPRAAAGGMELVVPAGVAALRLPGADPLRWQQSSRACEAAWCRAQDRQSHAAWVRQALGRCEDRPPSLEEMAGLLDVAPRTLARYLEAEGARYRDLVLQTRLERARHLLRDTPASVIDIAQRLGYSDSANFSRAFKAATGVAPRHYRLAHGRAGAAGTIAGPGPAPLPSALD